ncbi:MAG TPA: type II toxin-antitoxin system RelE/ParE family toxin [Pseudobdellovibrionaceae bacterium]|jgi:phage-related protein
MGLHLSKQVLKDIQGETKEIQEKLLILFRALEEGASLTMPVSRQMSGYPGLKELRVRDSRGIVRVFYYVQQKDHVFILHLFRKKTQKTPPQEIEIAIQRLKRMKEEFHG